MSSKGFHHKFNVERTDGRDQPGCDKDNAIYFVLDLANDNHALAALYGYIESLKYDDDNPELRADLERLAEELFNDKC